MAAQNMWFGLTGEIPGMSYPLAQTKINEALGRIYDEQMWSFQLKESGWLTPGLLFGAGSQLQSTGTITTVPFSPYIVGDTDASAIWAAYNTAGTLPLLTQIQIRSPYYSLYNIIAYDTTSNAPFGTFTLDRPWMEPGGVAQSYMIYQAYFPVPVTDFKRFFTIRDTTNAAPVDFSMYNQTDLAVIDPQRTNFNQPAYAVPYEVDARVGSATLGCMLYELWPHPLSQLPYTMSYLRRGPLMTLPSDTVPYPLQEELVMWRAKEVSYQWKEAQKSDEVRRGNGADYHYLADRASAEYRRELKIISDRDRDMVDLYFKRFVRDSALGFWGEPFATINGGLNVGR